MWKTGFVKLGHKFSSEKFSTHLTFIAIIYNRWKFIMLPLAVAIMLVKAAAARICTSPSMENQRQLASYFRYPLDPSGPPYTLETCPTWGPTEDESLGCRDRSFISPQNLWLSIWHQLSRKSYFANEREIGIKQP